MAPKELATATANDNEETGDDVLKLVHGLAGDATDAYASFKKKLAAGALADSNALAIEVGEIFSIVADVAEAAFKAHADHFQWGSEVDTELDEIKEQLAGEGTTILPEDAARLKSTILALVQNLRPAAGDEDVIEALKKQAGDAIAFIDESTADDEEEGDDEDEETTE